MVETQRPSRTKSCRPGYDDHEKSCTCFPGGRSLVLHGLHVSCEDGVGCIQQYLSLMNLHQADLCEVKITQSRQLCDLYIFPKQVWPLCHCCVDLVSPIPVNRIGVPAGTNPGRSPVYGAVFRIFHDRGGVGSVFAEMMSFESRVVRFFFRLHDERTNCDDVAIAYYM